jgi:DNA topoisomerase-2
MKKNLNLTKKTQKKRKQDSDTEEDEDSFSESLSESFSEINNKKEAKSKGKSNGKSKGKVKDNDKEKTKENSKETNTVESIYQKKTQIEHILLRPDTYIGSVDKIEEKMWVLDDTNQTFVSKTISYVPGLYKIFDEILVNAIDNIQSK